MRVTRKSRLRVRLENLAFVALFLGVVALLAFLSTRYHLQLDWTAGGRNTLSEASQALLGRLEGPITVTAYATGDPILRDRIQDLVDRYRRQKADIALGFVDPATAPDRVRELAITVDGELLIEYRGRREHVESHTEQAFTNALQRVARGGERRLVFLTGHGERDPRGRANHDLGDWGQQLERRGLQVESLNLAETREVPAATTVLVIAGPRVGLLPGETELVRGYLARGGSLLWLADPGGLQGLDALAEDLGVEFRPGTIVDPTTQHFAIDNPAMALVTRYPPHESTEGFDMITVFPLAAPVAARDGAAWEARPLLTTSPNAWAETGELRGEVAFDPGNDLQGPLEIGVALSRPRPGEGAASTPPDAAGPAQRVVVIGDGDFLSNAYLGNGGNLDLGMSLASWLASDDVLIAVPTKTAPDLSLALSETAILVIGFGFLLVLPLGLAAAGVAIWYRRRKR
jgi:ABC-type uncharacterized transport system involved in gliding motility auxiliary subunit